MNPGEYTSPLVRKTVVQCPVMSGYVTARLQAQDWFTPPISGVPTSIMATFENVGNTYFSVVLNETDDRSISGTRTALVGFSGTAAYLVPGGQQALQLNGKHNFLEVYCTGTTTGELRLQLESQRRWNQLGIDRADPFYPWQLWRAKEVPGVLS